MTTLADVFGRLGRPRVLVLGDLMLDCYTWGSAQRISPEAPVLVLSADREEARLGGAGSVAALLRGLEAEVVVAGVLGDDASGRVVRRLLDDSGIDGRFAVTDRMRPTTTKERIIGRTADRHAHQLLRVDREVSTPLDVALARDLADKVLSEITTFQAMLVSDYGKGTCSPWLLQILIRAAIDADIPVLVDPARNASYNRYRGADIIKPNRAEAAQAWGHPIVTTHEAVTAGEFLCREFDLGATVVTLDQGGMALARPGREGVVFPTKSRSIYDITGAGDMALAMLGLCSASQLELSDSVELANIAAGLEIDRFGVEPVSRADVAAAIGTLPAALSPPIPVNSRKLITAADIPGLVAEFRRAGKRVVFTNGCFDLLHVGHVTYLYQAAALGDILVVGVNSDASVRRHKGVGRPVIRETDRATMLAALGCVDYVVIFDEETPESTLLTLRPNVLVKGGTYTIDQVIGKEIVASYGGEVHVVGHVPGVSTTEIVNRMKASEGQINLV